VIQPGALAQPQPMTLRQKGVTDMADKTHIDEAALMRPAEISREALRGLIKAAEAGSAKIVG
jgi:hypothetical protein